MINICTLSDKNYLQFGLALHESISESCSEDFVLHYLCIDEESYASVKSKESKSLKAYSVTDLKSTQDFQDLVENTVYSPMSSDASNTYCFSLASFFLKFLLDSENLEDIFYVDADILFYNDIGDIHRLASQKSIAIMLHRHNSVGCHVGGYNVGLIYFKHDQVGYECLSWWRNCVINPKNKWAAEYGACGDQKYLEAFEPLFGKENICIIDEEIGHGAPWNLGLYEYLSDTIGGEFLWRPFDHQKQKIDTGLDFPSHLVEIEGETFEAFESKKQKMYFIHFSQFSPDYANMTFAFDRNNCWHGLNLYSNQSAINYYSDYLIKTHKHSQD